MSSYTQSQLELIQRPSARYVFDKLAVVSFLCVRYFCASVGKKKSVLGLSMRIGAGTVWAVAHTDF